MPKYYAIRTVELRTEIEADSLEEAVKLMSEMGGSAFDDERVIREEVYDENGREWSEWDVAEEEVE